jgi:spore maturation protein CgeB
MKLVVFGLTVSSSWGNGHATLWRGLIRALARMGHVVTFFERDVPYYARHRDLTRLAGAELVLYPSWHDIAREARRQVAEADVVMVTSYCPDATAASRLILDTATRARRVYYDLDTPVTLAQLRTRGKVDYLPADGLDEFDLVLSFTGGAALEALRRELGARKVAPLYGHVDPEAYRPVAVSDAARSDLSYLGTFAADRQPVLESLFVAPARQMQARRFVLGGTGYPDDFPWQQNIWFVNHVAPADHPAFFASSRLTLNVTRADMSELGYCPSGRLFEAAACGVPVLSDCWSGLDQFFAPGEEILLARSTEEALQAIAMPPDELARIGRAARDRVLAQHTSAQRAHQLVRHLEN